MKHSSQQAMTEDEKEEFGNEIYEFVHEIYPKYHNYDLL